MRVTLFFADGSESPAFEAESFDLTNDVAQVDGIVHTDVESVNVRA